jgi:hypothetical protein
MKFQPKVTVYCVQKFSVLSKIVLSCLIKGFTIPIAYPTKLLSIVNTCCKLIDLFITGIS